MNNPLTGYIWHLLPEIVLGLSACVLFLGATWRVSRHVWGTVALLMLVLAGLTVGWTASNVPTLEGRQAGLAQLQGDEQAAARQVIATTIYAAPVVFTKLALFFKVLGLLTGALLICLGWNDAGDEHAGEYHACLLLIVAGICLTGAANDLITLFLALELISIPTYVLLYLPRVDAKAQEAAMKYFLLSIFSSGLLLFGMSYLYGLAGTTNIPGILEAMATRRTDAERAPWLAMSLLSVVMIVAGLGFRITAVPFHFYAPDVYQGTTTPAAALLAFVPKIVGFAAMLRVLGYISVSPMPDTLQGQALSDQVPMLLWIMAAVTMTLGNILALLQTNIKRLLAYSSVAHAGYMLIGMAVVPYISGERVGGENVGGVEALLFYLVAYGCMTVGAFSVLHYLSSAERPVETIDDLAGLSKSHPNLALVMVLFLFSLIGIPLTAGFAGKFLLFFDAMGANENLQSQPAGLAFGTFTLFRINMTPAMLCRILAVIAAINAAIGAFYYLKMAIAMYLRDGIEPLPQPKRSPVLVTIAACAFLTLALGVYPMGLLQTIRSVMPGKTPTGTTKIEAPAPRIVAER